MKYCILIQGLFAVSVVDERKEYSSSAFGVWFVNCDQFFHGDHAWPLQEHFPNGDTVRLCQNRNMESPQFASLFNVKTKIPIYTAAKVRRLAGMPTYSRPSSNWHHLSLALCMDPTYNISAIAHKSFYSNIDATFSKYYEFCAVHQALDTDYKGNTETLHIDRGHLMPNGMANQDELMQKTTFSLTNVAPQYGNFNQQAWNHLECLVKSYLEIELPDEFAYVITGTHEIKEILNTDDEVKHELTVPKYYWKAFCYENEGTAYSWVYMQLNSDDQKLGGGEYFLTVSNFTETYFDGKPLFDNTCQNADYGPWDEMRTDWDGARKKYKC